MKRILVGMDLSAAANAAVRRACQIASDIGAEVRIVFVIPQPANEARRDAAEDALDRTLKAVLPAIHPPLTTGVAFGAPDAALCEEAEEFAPDLVVIAGNPDEGRERIVGAIAIRLLQCLPCPLLIALASGDRPYRTVLAAREARSGDRMVDVASQIPSIRHLYLVEGSDLRPGFDLGEDASDDGAEGASDEMNMLIDRAVDEGASGTAMMMHPIVGPGDLVAALTQAWRAVKPDLAIVTRHGGSGISWLLNDCAMETTLLSDPGDVLVLP